jgi:AcrR family transcriptional regulator
VPAVKNESTESYTIGKIQSGVRVAGIGSRGPYAKSAVRRDAILDAALLVFASNGYRGGSLEDIAEQVAVTKAALRYYFLTKAELFTAVLERRDELAFEVSPLDQDDPVEALQGLVRLTAHNMSMPGVVALHTTIAAEAVAHDHPAHAYYIARYAFIVGRLTEILERCRTARLLAAGVEPARTARAIVAMIDGLQIQWLTDPEGIDIVDDLDQYLRSLLTSDANWDRFAGAWTSSIP